MKQATLAAALCALAAPSFAQSTVVGGPMGFDPISDSAYGQSADPSAPFVVPAGFDQVLVSDEADLDLYRSLCASGVNPGSDWPDMSVANETKKSAGRFLYRTHEVRPFLYDTACSVTPAAIARYKEQGGGAVSVIDLHTGATSVLAQRADWEALDGLLWTPWHTLLFAEESINADIPDPQVPQATSGLLYEVTLRHNNPAVARAVEVRPQLGSLSHEGIEVDAEGNVYVIDEDRRGSIYRFVPNKYGNLEKGQLQVLVVAGGAKTGFASWVDLDMAQVQISARIAAQTAGGTPFCRPEDLERIGDVLYAALTCEDVANSANTSGPGAVLAIELGEAPIVRYFAAPGVNVPVENRTAGVTGMRAVDNLANGPDGKLWIVEDNVPSDIWVAEPDNDGDGYADAVHLFASLKDRTAEGTGIYFGSDPKTLFVNIQHSETGNDSTIAITKRPE
jgi:hypothetical protein